MIHRHINDIPDSLQLSKEIAIDTETMGLNLHRDRLCLLQMNDGGKDTHLIQFKEGNYHAPNLRSLLNDSSVLKIMHYARFDMATLNYHLKTDIQNVFCTKIASKLARTYTEYHSLRELCREIIGINLSKQQQSSYWGADKLTKEQEDYAAGDVLYLHKIKRKLTQMLKTEDRLDLAQKIFDFLPTRVNLDIMGWNDIFAH